MAVLAEDQHIVQTWAKVYVILKDKPFKSFERIEFRIVLVKFLSIAKKIVNNISISLKYQQCHFKWEKDIGRMFFFIPNKLIVHLNLLLKIF